MYIHIYIYIYTCRGPRASARSGRSLRGSPSQRGNKTIKDTYAQNNQSMCSLGRKTSLFWHLTAYAQHNQRGVKRRIGERGLGTKPGLLEPCGAEKSKGSSTQRVS